jgi:glutathione S-transferase
MYPMVQLPLDRHPNVVAWLDRVGNRPSIVRSLEVPTAH